MQATISSSALMGPLQQYMLPQLTPDALIILRTTCKALHRLVTTAPFAALQPTLQTLMPPRVRHCATDSHSMGALLKSQRALRQCFEAGAGAKLQKLLVTDLGDAWEYHWGCPLIPHWALESPCRRLVLQCSSDDDDADQALLDPCNLLASPDTRWLTQGHNPFWSFLKGGALIQISSGLALLDMETHQLTRTWECPHRCLDCQAGLDSGLICIIASAASDNTDEPLHTISVAVLDQSSLRELLVVAPPSGPCLDAMAASRPPAAVTCKWVQPSPDRQHIGIYWCYAVNRSCSRLCIYTLHGAQLVADIDCQMVFGSLPIHSCQPEWSPDSLSILFPKLWWCIGAQPLAPGILVANVSGSYSMLGASTRRAKQLTSFSADGEYVHIHSSSSSNAQPAQFEIRGSVWRVKTGEEVLSWQGPSNACSAVWSPAGSSIMLPDLSLAILPAGGSSAAMIRQSYHGPDCGPNGLSSGRQSGRFIFSPSGSTLVGTWRKCDSSRSMLQLPEELWHASCSFDSPSCPMTLVATDAMGWLPASILFNPSPWNAHVYAIFTGEGSLHLIDAEQHRSLCSWSCTELAGYPCESTPYSFDLSWSPDGSQLLALGNGRISLLTFGPAANGAPHDASPR